MPGRLGYPLGSVLLGLLAVPALVSGGVALAAGPVSGTGASLLVGAVVAALIAGPLWWWRGRRPGRPERWLAALLPVAAVPAAFLLFWVVTFAVTDGLGSTLDIFALPALPWLLLTLAASLTGNAALVPVTLGAVLLASVGGFVLGARRDSEPSGRPGLVGVLCACLLLVAVTGAQVGQRVAEGAGLAGEASMSDEVPLWDYRPFAPGNRLATPDRPASLRIAGSFPRLDGATALYPVYAAIAQATYVLPDGLDEEGRYQFAEQNVACSTTSQAYRRLIEGEVDAIFVAQPSAGQRARAEAAGVELRLTPIGREAFVFFVNEANPVRNLTLDQVRDIYSRRITNWKQVGGADQPIIAFQRPEDSGSQTAMLAMVMKDRQPARPLKEERAATMGGVITEVAGYRDLAGAIGYSFRWYATVMNANPHIRLVAIDGIEPTVANIRDGSYPLTGQLNIVTAGAPTAATRSLIEWTVSAAGQDLLEKTGYVRR